MLARPRETKGSSLRLAPVRDKSYRSGVTLPPKPVLRWVESDALAVCGRPPAITKALVIVFFVFGCSLLLVLRKVELHKKRGLRFSTEEVDAMGFALDAVNEEGKRARYFEIIEQQGRRQSKDGSLTQDGSVDSVQQQVQAAWEKQGLGTRDEHRLPERGIAPPHSNDNVTIVPNGEEEGRYLGACYDACEHVRNLLLGPDFVPRSIHRLRSVTCVHFIPGRGICDSMVSARRISQDVYTKSYMENGRKFLANVSMALPASVGGTVVFVPSDSTNAISDQEIDALWENKTPLLPHSISRRGTSKYIMIPDYHFINTRGFQLFRERVNASEIPFAERAPIVFWRGSSTSEGLDCPSVQARAVGDSFEQSGCATTARVQAALLARDISHVDSKIVAATDCCAEFEDEMSATGIMARRVPEHLWAQYRGVLEMDGLVNAWGLFWRLYSGSVVFRVDGKYSGIYEDKLKPWIHYIPLAVDLSDLREKTALVLSNKTADVERLSRIGNNARQAVRGITYEGEVQRVAAKLAEMWEA